MFLKGVNLDQDHAEVTMKVEVTLPGKRKLTHSYEEADLPQLPVLTNHSAIKKGVELIAPVDVHLEKFADEIAKKLQKEKDAKAANDKKQKKA